jgi:hypothetical protein
VRVVARPSLRPFTAHAQDVNEGGLSFLHDVWLEEGTPLAVQLATGPRGSPRLRASRVRTARVVRVLAAHGLWLVRCTVSPPFSAEELEGLR